MEETNQFYPVLTRLKAKYEDKIDLNEDDYIELIEHCKNEYMFLRNDHEIEEFSTYEITWVRRACMEVIDRLIALPEIGNVGGVKQYSENGFSFTTDGFAISNALRHEVVPKLKVIE